MDLFSAAGFTLVLPTVSSCVKEETVGQTRSQVLVQERESVNMTTQEKQCKYYYIPAGV